jgi:hypothetical protein
MEIGDTFVARDPRVDDHLQIVISDPAQDPTRVVLVSLTSYDQFAHEMYKDASCLLYPADHPWIEHATCVSYRDARVVSDQHLDDAVAKGPLEKLEPVRDDVLRRILEGAERTDELPNKCRQILEEQGLIEG